MKIIVTFAVVVVSLDSKMNVCKIFKEAAILGGPYHIETSSLIYGANQWTGFYITRASAIKELMGFFYNFFFAKIIYINIMPK